MSRTAIISLSDNSNLKPSFHESLLTLCPTASWIHIEPFNEFNSNGDIIFTQPRQIKFLNVPDNIFDQDLIDLLNNHTESISPGSNLLYSINFPNNTGKIRSNSNYCIHTFYLEKSDITSCNIIVGVDKSNANAYIDIYNLTEKNIICKFEQISNTQKQVLNSSTIINQITTNSIIEIRANSANSNLTLYYVGITS